MRPICVDLDGTLINTDLLFESTISYIKENPINIFSIIPLLTQKAELKFFLSNKVDLPIEFLPYNQNVLDYLKSEKERQIILVTGSHEKYAKQVSDYLQIFQSFYGTTREFNLTGKNKRDFLVSKFGEKGFDYIGNSSEDIHVWTASNEAISVVKKSWPVPGIKYLPQEKPGLLKTLSKLLRIHQWSKNFLVFLPLLLAHQLSNSLAWTNAFFAFLSFCLMASAVYILNDISDIENDRRHPTKRYRPIPSGQVPLLSCFAFFLALVLGSIVLSSQITLPYATAFPLGYLALNILYSNFLKKMLVIDIIILTSFYLIRILYGSYAADTFTSHWLLSFSFFTFFSLAINKRYTEVLLLFNKQGRKSASGRAYEFNDLPILLNLGVSCGIAATVVLSLYIQFGVRTENYPSSDYLWLIPILFILWVSSLWIRTTRGKVDDDPVKFALKDRFSIIIFLITVLVVIKASL